MMDPPWMAVRAEIEVRTFKEGLLSRVAHDLLLRVDDPEVEVDAEAGAVRVRIDASSLRTVCAMKDGREAPAMLSPEDLRDIDANLRADVLEARRHPEIRFDSTSLDDRQVAGTLHLHGEARRLETAWHTEDGWRTAEVEIDQRDWGIKPFKAMMGTLKVQPRIRVRIRLRWPG